MSARKGCITHMDNTQFGAFVAQLRKEQGLTQKELADKVNVTDKAVSKWETGKGFPDMKLLEPLAHVLGVSLVELMQGKRQEAETLTVAEANAAVSQAMGQSERTTAQRYLRLFRWSLTAACALCLVWLYPLSKFWHTHGNTVEIGTDSFMTILTAFLYRFSPSELTYIGAIGGTDGPTAILTASQPVSFLDLFLQVGVPFLLLIVCIILAIKVWRLEKRLK